ncbi:MAG: family transposase [Verrucomicrobiales bacterium]|nr:family transposase [Verrucomicrobiales bacterium]
MAKRRSQRPVRGLFTQQEREAKVAAKTTVLDVLDLTLDWEMFRLVLDRNLDFRQPEPGQPVRSGRSAFDAVLMFKVLILQKYHALSDDQCEYQINDRHSFQRFLGLEREGRIPDAKTIWRFRERLGPEGVEALFAAFDGFLRERGLLLRAGKVIDASFVDVPRQHNSRSENQQIKDGQIPDGWEQKPAFHRQKDTGARHTQKNGERHYDYKNHAKGGLETKLIETWTATDASVHDSRALPDLISETSDADTILYADSACRSASRSWSLSSMESQAGCMSAPGATLP